MFCKFKIILSFCKIFLHIYSFLVGKRPILDKFYPIFCIS